MCERNLAGLTTMLAAMLLIAACTTPGPTVPGSREDPYVITITWKDDGESCEVDEVSAELPSCEPPFTGPCAGRNDWIQWESAPVPIVYRIYFDPLKRSPDKSGGNGVLKRKIDEDAPFAEYKYSILRDRCDPDTDTYDPRFRIDR